MDKIEPKVDEKATVTPPVLSSDEIARIKRKHRKAEERRVVKKPNKDKVSVRDAVKSEPILHPNDVPTSLNDVNVEWCEYGAELVNQSGAMKALIQPLEETKTAVVKTPVKFVRSGYSTIKVGRVDHQLLEKVHTYLQKPIQPPARMGYLSALETSNKEFFKMY
jgi:hypothetical protein